MNVLITGKGGQLAWELEQTAPTSANVTSLGRSELDVSDREAVLARVTQLAPDVIINAAAYTAVDKAESDRARAYQVNESGALNLAEACRTGGARLVHVSTDFVFNGRSNKPYTALAATDPLGVYGASKLAGEKSVLELLPESSVVVRSAWVYSSHGNNFVKTMLRLMQEKPQLGVVYDQIGTPTWARGLAVWLWAVVDKPEINGIYHWTDAGVASWYDFAVAIQALALDKGLLTQEIPIRPIPASAYPTPAQRPAFSVLDKTSAEAATGMDTVHWRYQLSCMLDQLAAQDSIG